MDNQEVMSFWTSSLVETGVIKFQVFRSGFYTIVILELTLNSVLGPMSTV